MIAKERKHLKMLEKRLAAGMVAKLARCTRQVRLGLGLGLGLG